jgi:hypothetical protein
MFAFKTVIYMYGDSGSRSADSNWLRAERLKCRSLSLSMFENFACLHIVHTGSGAHPASYAIGIGGSFPGAKAVGA